MGRRRHVLFGLRRSFRNLKRAIEDGYDFLLDVWDKLFPVDPLSPTKLYTANGLTLNGVDQYGTINNILLNTDWFIEYIVVCNNESNSLVGGFGASSRIYHKDDKIVFVSATLGTPETITFNGSGFNNAAIKLVATSDDNIKLFVDNIFISEQPISDTSFNITYIGTRDITLLDKFTGDIQYLNINNVSEYNFTGGLSDIAYDLQGGNDIVLTGNVSNNMWLTGLDTTFNLLTAPETLDYNIYPVFNGSNTGVTWSSNLIDLNAQSFTIFCVASTSSNSGFRYLNSRPNGALGAVIGMQIGWGGASWGNVILDDGFGNSIDWGTATQNIDDGQDHIIALTFDTLTGSGIFYIDGVSQGTKTNASLIGCDFNPIDNEWRFGVDANGTQRFNGVSINNGIYDYILTPTEIANLTSQSIGNIGNYNPFNNWNGGVTSGTFGMQGSNETSVGSGIDGFGMLIQLPPYVGSVTINPLMTQTALMSWNPYEPTATTVTVGGQLIIPEDPNNLGFDLFGEAITRPVLQDGFNFTSQDNHRLDSGVNLGRDTKGALGVQTNTTNQSYLLGSFVTIVGDFNVSFILSDGFDGTLLGRSDSPVDFVVVSPTDVIVIINAIEYTYVTAVSDNDLISLSRVGVNLELTINEASIETKVVGTEDCIYNEVSRADGVFRYLSTPESNYLATSRSGGSVSDLKGSNNLTLTSDLVLLPVWSKSADGITWVLDADLDLSIGGSTDIYWVRLENLEDMNIAGDDVYNNILDTLKLAFEFNANSTIDGEPNQKSWLYLMFMTDGLGGAYLYAGGLSDESRLVHVGDVGIAQAAIQSMLYGNVDAVSSSLNGYMSQLLHYPIQLSSESSELIRVITSDKIPITYLVDDAGDLLVDGNGNALIT